MALAQAWFLAPSGRQLPYSEFKQLVRSNQVAEVTVGDQTIHGTLKTERNNSRTFTTTRIEDRNLVEELDSHGVKYTGECGSRWLPEVLGWIVPLLLLVGLWSFFFRRMSGAEGGVMSFARSKARVFSEDDVKVSFADVAGVDEAEQELKEIVEFLKNPKKYTNLGGRIPKGVLLVGPPGTGKTLLARAVAGEAKVPFFSLSGSEFVEMFVGVGAARVRDLFAQAEAKAPCIIFIDELDALGKTRGQSPMGSHEEREQTLNPPLGEMDGFNTDCAVVVIAATNRPDVLDPALLRSGRFDRRVAIDAPDLNGRRAILSLYAAQKPLAENIDLDVVARQTPGFTGADLANLLNEAAILAARNKKLAIGRQELDEASLRVMAGPEKRSRMITPEEKSIIAYHEVGHALVMKSIATSDPVHKVSVVSRGQALGVTIQLPLKDRYLTSKSELMARMAAAMGGRAAEEIIFGDVTTGAKQDIEQATTIARQMVCEFGMSERLGLVTWHRRGEGDSLFFSELTAADVDGEVKALTDAAYRQAYDICQARRTTLVRIAEHLQVVETIDGDELDRLLVDDAVPVAVTLQRVEESAAAGRIAAAEAHDWEDTSAGSAGDGEAEPPIAAS